MKSLALNKSDCIFLRSPLHSASDRADSLSPNYWWWCGMAENRRNFLKKAGGVTALVAAAPLGSVLSEPAAPIRTAAAAEVAPNGSFALKLDGEPAGRLISSTGGTAFGPVIKEAAIPGEFTKKHLGEIQYQPIQLECNADLDARLVEWLVDSLTPGKPIRKDGTIQIADFNGNVVSELN